MLIFPKIFKIFEIPQGKVPFILVRHNCIFFSFVLWPNTPKQLGSDYFFSPRCIVLKNIMRVFPFILTMGILHEDLGTNQLTSLLMPCFNVSLFLVRERRPEPFWKKAARKNFRKSRRKTKALKPIS